jgi:hypothetical protein
MNTAVRLRLRRPGVTLCDLIVVSVLAALAIALAAPALWHARASAAQALCSDHLRYMGFACHTFEGSFMRLPPLYGGAANPSAVPIVAPAASAKFPRGYGSVHVFLLPHIHQPLHKLMAGADPFNFVPDTADAKGARANFNEVPTYVCPADPSMTEGIVAGVRKGGTSYAANAQVFAPLTTELLSGPNNMLATTKLNWADRGATVARIQDGSSNTIMFLHVYARCGALGGGAAWGETAGARAMPDLGIGTIYPWQRSSLMGQVVTTAPGAKIFNDVPHPFHVSYAAESGRGCDPTVPSTPHAGAMMVALADASVRIVSPTISPQVWNMACLPNDMPRIPCGDW